MHRFIVSALVILLLSTMETMLPLTNAEALDACSYEYIEARTTKDRCSSFSMTLREDGVTYPARIAQVYRSTIMAGDVGIPHYDYFVALPDGTIFELGDYKPMNSYPYNRSLAAQRHLYGSLGISPTGAGGACCIKPDLFYERFIERVGEQFCVSYVMKHPFRGTYTDCDGIGEPIGKIGYVDGVPSWREAGRLACSQFMRDTGRPCENAYHSQLFTIIQRDPGGSLYYTTAFRKFVRIVLEHSTPASTPVEYDYYIYRVDAISSEVELVEYTKQVPKPRDWM